MNQMAYRLEITVETTDGLLTKKPAPDDYGESIG